MSTEAATGPDTNAPHQRILILEQSSEAAEAACRSLKDAVPSAEIVTVRDRGTYEAALHQGDFDVVVIDYDLPDVQSVEFIQSHDLRDNSPKVLLVSSCTDAATVRMLAEARRTWIVRDEKWIQSLKFAIRDALRVRRLEHERLVLRAQLTEANSMLEERNRRLDEFCSTVAHDIRGPLAGLMLKVEYIMDSYKGKLDERCTKLLGRSLNAAERVVGIVQAMYEFAKVGARATQREPVNLKEIALEVLGDLNVGESKEVDVGVDELPEVWGDAALLRRVFINLVSNAIKYNDKPTARLNIGYLGDVERSIGRFAQIYVEDNGPGVPADQVDGIFKMFRRGVSPEGKSEGLGVGLAVVQKIIELHYGRIELASNPGGGCRFTFLLPREKLAISGDRAVEASD